MLHLYSLSHPVSRLSRPKITSTVIQLKSRAIWSGFGFHSYHQGSLVKLYRSNISFPAFNDSDIADRTVFVPIFSLDK